MKVTESSVYIVLRNRLLVKEIMYYQRVEGPHPPARAVAKAHNTIGLPYPGFGASATSPIQQERGEGVLLFLFLSYRLRPAQIEVVGCAASALLSSLRGLFIVPLLFGHLRNPLLLFGETIPGSS